MLESPEERVDLLKKGMEGKNLEHLYIIFNNFKIIKNQDISQKVNCWEFMNCGREIGGEKAGTLGVCPTAFDTSSEGLNQGKLGGRICWAIAGTFSGKKVEGYFARNMLSCESCYFFQIVKKDEEKFGHFLLVKPGNK
jgi:hypothetical protein